MNTVTFSFRFNLDSFCIVDMSHLQIMYFFCFFFFSLSPLFFILSLILLLLLFVRRYPVLSYSLLLSCYFYPSSVPLRHFSPSSSSSTVICRNSKWHPSLLRTTTQLHDTNFYITHHSHTAQEGPWNLQLYEQCSELLRIIGIMADACIRLKARVCLVLGEVDISVFFSQKGSVEHSTFSFLLQTDSARYPHCYTLSCKFLLQQHVFVMRCVIHFIFALFGTKINFRYFMVMPDIKFVLLY